MSHRICNELFDLLQGVLELVVKSDDILLSGLVLILVVLHALLEMSPYYLTFAFSADPNDHRPRF